jgi:hypothetical protein
VFTLYDNRTELYQWDLNRKVIVEDITITEVHFCNRTTDCSLVVRPYWLQPANLFVADIPNEILQHSFDIRVYAYCDEYTKVEEVLKVKPRTRPADYVYTETEVIQYSTLVDRMDALEKDLTNTVAEEVNRYVAENPPQADFSNYYNKTETENIVNEAVGNISIPEVPTNVSAFANDANYATEGYVTEAIDAIDLPEVDFTGYATEEYVNDAVANIKIPDVDLTNYYTKPETDNLLSNIETDVVIYDDGSGNVTIEAGEGTGGGGGGSADLSNYYTKGEVDDIVKNNNPYIPTSLSEFSNDMGYTTYDEVTQLVAGATGTDMSNYYTKAEVDELVSNSGGGGSSGGVTFIEIGDSSLDFNYEGNDPVVEVYCGNPITYIKNITTKSRQGLSIQLQTDKGCGITGDQSIWYGDDCSEGMFQPADYSKYTIYAYYHMIQATTVCMVMRVG